MSVPFVSVIPFAVLGASVLGSGHCIAMCGGLITTVARDRNAVLRYHLGRLLGYCGLGALAGFLGEEIFQSDGYAWLPWISTTLLSFGFVFLGVRLWSGRSLHFFVLPRSLWKQLSGLGAGTTGLLSVFLPCGWLHAFVLGAVATRSAALGALYLLFFWMGTLPALTIAPLAIKKLFQPFAKRAPKISAIVLITIGLGSIGMKMMSSYSHMACHCDQDQHQK